jgi:hypothetical protein
VRGQTGKGANLTLFFGAGNGFAQLAKNRVRLAFPASFSLVHFFWRSKRNERYPIKRIGFFLAPAILDMH